MNVSNSPAEVWSADIPALLLQTNNSNVDITAACNSSAQTAISAPIRLFSCIKALLLKASGGHLTETSA